MKILLSGGAGFVAPTLRSTSFKTVTRSPLRTISRPERENVPEGAHFYERNIRSGCAEVFEQFGPEALCYQAAQIDVRRSVR